MKKLVVSLLVLVVLSSLLGETSLAWEAPQETAITALPVAPQGRQNSSSLPAGGPDGGERPLSPDTPVWLWAGGGRLYDVSFAGDDGWLAGWYGTAGYSDDGGTSWEGQYVGRTDADLYGITAIDANHVWAVANDGSSGAVLHSWNGGQAWVKQASDGDWSFWFGDVAFVDNSNGWAVGTDNGTSVGLILRTADGGDNWSQQSSGTSSSLHGVAFADASNGWAVGDSGVILHTTNGGATWTAQGSGTTETLQDVFAWDSQKAWAVGTNATILRTTDGGSTWTPAASAGTAANLNAVAFGSASKGWAVGDGATIIWTNDGGKNWTAQASGFVPYGYALYGVVARSTSDLVVVGDHGALLRTTDGGITWTSWGPIATLRNVDFPAAGTGWIVGWDETIAHTADGALTWTAQDSGLNMADLEGVSFVDTNTGYAVGDDASGNGVILRTTDGGANWSQAASSPTAAELYDVDAWDATRAWAGGLKYIYGTTDGVKWTRQYTSFWYLHGVDFVSATEGWVVGEGSGAYGKVLHTSDGGANWTEQWANPNTPGLRDVFMGNTQIGWAVGEGASSYQSLIVHTTDGKNWSKQYPPIGTCEDLEGVVFISASKGWTVGESAAVLRTENGGANWTAETAQSSAWLYGVAYDGADLWAVGDTSTILKRALIPDPPAADFSGTPLTGALPLTVNFTDLSTCDPTAWRWEFGDGDTSTEQNPIHVYDTAGVYTVMLTAVNAGGDDDEVKTSYVTVDAALVADFQGMPQEGEAPLTVDFTDLSAGGPTAWWWEFGDGTHSDSQHKSYTYYTPGIYTVTLTVTNTGGSDTEVKTNYITVTMPTCGDPYEPNETFADAYLLDPLDPAGYYPYICYPADQDYFKFNAVLGDVMTLTLDSLPKNYDLELWDPDGVLVRWSYNGGTAPEQIHFTVSNWEGEYRARVFGAGGQYNESQPYHLTIQVGSMLPPTLTVNTTDDLNDGVCDATHCSLREAINTTNSSDSYKITFDIPESDPGFDWIVWTIQPAAPLPTVTHGINLDASTQTANRGNSNPNGPEIVLDGSVAGSGNGLALLAGSTIEGFTIHNWAAAGIYAQGTIQTKIYGCYIGTGRFGISAAGNQDGVVIVGGHSAHIGGEGVGEGNLISGNIDNGIHLSGTAYAQVWANYIGTDRAGASAVGNGDYGIYLSNGAEWNTIGGDRDTHGNLISGNAGDGIRVDNSGSLAGHNKVWGNRIGVNADMSGAIANVGYGVRLHYSNFNTVGSDNPDRGNVIGGNRGGIYLRYAGHNDIVGNWIGAEPGGLIHLGNDWEGVYISGASQFNTIGPGNVIAHNDEDGVRVYGSDATRNTITQNSITDNGDLGINNWNGGNEELTPPIITLATLSYIEGAACPLCRVEIFGDPAGEGIYYDGAATATVYGEWVWYGSPSWGPANATATATDSDDNTSEFSTCTDEYEPNDDFDQAIVIDLGEEISSYVCYPYADDYFQVTVEPRSVISVVLEMPHNYVLSLYDSEQTLLEQSVSGTPSTRSFTYTTMTGGNFYVRVGGFNDAHDPAAPYTLRVTAESFPTLMRAWVDEGWIGSPAVYKLIPDAGEGPRDGTWMDIIVEASTDGIVTLDTYIVLDVPGDAFGAPYAAYERYCLGCALNEVSWGNLGGGSYRARLRLSPFYGPGLYGQMVFRFYLRETAAPGEVVPHIELRHEPSGAAVVDTSVPPVHLVTNVGALVITSRRHLYENYNLADAAELLAQVTQASQGIGPGTNWSAIYYVDDYSTLARDWDNRYFDPSSQAAANAAHDAIDDLIEDWVEDSGGRTQYLLILGDDDVVPMGRRSDRCDDDDTESAHGGYGHWAVDRLITNDFYLTENWYADTNGSGAEEGELELYVGRVIGDSAADMLALFQNGLDGPVYDRWSPRAVLASWDGWDLHYGSASYASVLEHVRDWDFSVSSDLVDNDDWRKADLLSALGTQYSFFIAGTHGWPYGICAPPDSVDIGGDEIASVISATAPLRQPFYTLGGCRVGFTLVDDGIIDDLNHEGASGFVAGSGITWGYSEGSENYTEEVINNFSRRVFNDSGTERTVGSALRSAKADYGAGWRWSCKDEKGVMQVSLFGVPWMIVPRTDASLASTASNPADQQTPAFSVPSAALDGSYSVTFTVDASTYTLTQPASGFDLVEVDGFQQSMDVGPMLPAQDLTFPLPTGAEISEVSAQLGGETDLGTLNIPTFIPGIALYPDGRDAEWVETPAELGIVPSQPYTYEVKNLGSYQSVHVHLFPVSYDAASGQTILYQQITVTVNYTTPAALVLTDFYLDAHSYAPGQSLNASADLSNVTNQAATLTTTLRMVDVYGGQVSSTAGGPYTVPAGESQIITHPAPAPADEGVYSVILTLWQDGVTVAQVNGVVQVAAVQITDFDGPDSLDLGETAVFTVTGANRTASPLETGFALDITTERGKVVATLTSPTQTIPAGGQATATFTWESAGAAGGRYQVAALVSPAGYSARSLAQLFQLQERQFIYLPLVLNSSGGSQAAAWSGNARAEEIRPAVVVSWE